MMGRQKPWISNQVGVSIIREGGMGIEWAKQQTGRIKDDLEDSKEAR